MEATGFILFLMSLFSLAITLIAAVANTNMNDKGVEGFKPLGNFTLNMIVGIILMFTLSDATAWWIFVFGPAVGVIAFNIGRKIAGNFLGDSNK